VAALAVALLRSSGDLDEESLLSAGIDALLSLASLSRSATISQNESIDVRALVRMPVTRTDRTSGPVAFSKSEKSIGRACAATTEETLMASRVNVKAIQRFI
jgi:hypothetical protein